jgi:hypothetical protein
MADYFDSGKWGTIIAIPYLKANLTTEQTNLDMDLSGGGTMYTMPQGGSVVGVTIRGNAAMNAGTVTARAHNGSTEFAESGYPAPAIAANAQESYATCRPGTCTFDAGDSLGVSLTSTTNLQSETVDFDALLFVQLDPS